MAKTEVTSAQIQMAASVGVKLLQVDDLPVPLALAKSGALGILEGMLQALANGEVVLSPPTPPKEAVPDKVGEPQGDSQPQKSGNSGDSPPAE